MTHDFQLIFSVVTGKHLSEVHEEVVQAEDDRDAINKARELKARKLRTRAWRAAILVLIAKKVELPEDLKIWEDAS